MKHLYAADPIYEWSDVDKWDPLKQSSFTYQAPTK